MKRLFDIVASILALIVTAPLFFLIVVLIKLESGPVFYRQWRVGRGEKPFLIFKFRTMYDGAESRGPAITVGKDGRITPVGKILRRFELDELPTLCNVLKGDMSIVGPRPELPKYLPYYREDQKRVFSVRPGMTDPGTLQFRDEARLLVQAEEPERFYVERILPEKLRLNLEYVDRCGVVYDLGVIFKTWTLILLQTKP